MNDLKFALRQLLKNPGFTAVAVVSLALGIGAGTAVFSLVNGILLGALPVPNARELRVVEWSGADFKSGYDGNMMDDGAGRRRGNSFPQSFLNAANEQCASQAELFGYIPFDGAVRARHESFGASGLMVSDNFFTCLGIRPLLGRLLGGAKEEAGGIPVVISHRCWERQFDSDPGAPGQALVLNGRTFTVLGVLPRGFSGVRPGFETDFYVPVLGGSPDRWRMPLLARLKPGVSDGQFLAALDVIFARQAEKAMKQPRILLTDGRAGPDTDRHRYRTPLLLLLTVVVVVLLVACANLAGLSMARGAARQHEFALRAALGAARGRLIRQSLTESLLLGLLGGGAGVVIAFWGKTAISRLLAGSPEGLHYDTSIDFRVLGFTVSAAMLTALLSGILPALRAAGADPQEGLKSRGTLSAPRLRSGRALVTVQIALSLVLLSGAGLYVRTLVNLVGIKPGFATENLLLFQLNPVDLGYEGARTTEFFGRVQQSLAALPGVRSVALTQFPLLAGSSWNSSFILPQRPTEDGSERQAHMLTVGETFFSTLGIPMVLGRDLSAGDQAGAPGTVVVNEAFARKYFAGESPVDQTLRRNDADWRIVGVCRDLKYSDIRAATEPTVYLPFWQSPVGSAYFALRTMMPPLAAAASARKAVAAVDPNIPLTEISTQEQIRDRTISQERLFALLCGALALLAVLLSCIGLHSLMAYNVVRRTREFGIRMALGATRGKVAGPIVREALLLATLGVALGGPMILGMERLIESQLYGVRPHDPMTLGGAVLLLFAVALIAAWLPARRASRVDPMVALRYE